jgi:membrane associated rhomboid family serine protease
MPPDKTVLVICYTLGALGPLLLLFMTLRYRDSSRWIRSVFVAWALISIAWGALGFIRLFYSAHLTGQGRVNLDHWKTHMAGIALGLLISALLSPDFWKVSRHYRSYSWLRSNSQGLTKR